MKGFTKDGKFRPTGNRNKSSISREDTNKKNKFGQSVEAIDNQHSIAIKRRKESTDSYKLFDEPYTIKSKVPTHVTMSSPDSKLPPVSTLEGGSESVRDYWNNKNLRKRKDESIEDFHKRCKETLSEHDIDQIKEGMEREFFGDLFTEARMRIDKNPEKYNLTKEDVKDAKDGSYSDEYEHQIDVLQAELMELEIKQELPKRLKEESRDKQSLDNDSKQKELENIEEEIKELGDPVTHNDVSKIRKLDEKANSIRSQIKESRHKESLDDDKLGIYRVGIKDSWESEVVNLTKSKAEELRKQGHDVEEINKDKERSIMKNQSRNVRIK